MFDATFPSKLKHADVIPVFKKKDRNNVKNYRPASTLPNLSKLYDRCLYNQMYIYFSHIPLKWQCAFHNDFSIQSSCDDGKLVKMFEQRGHEWIYIKRSLKSI